MSANVNVKKYWLMGLAEQCGLCLPPADGRAKNTNGPVFQIQCEGGGGFSGPCCAQHVALLLKLEEPKPVAPTAIPAMTTNNTNPTGPVKPAAPATNAK